MKKKDTRSAAAVKSAELDAAALKEQLWGTLKAVRLGEMTPAQGDVVACQAREILRCVKTQLSIFSQSSRAVSRELIEFASPSSNGNK